MLKRWDGFVRFLDDGRICLTNNAAERALRGSRWDVSHGSSQVPNAAPTGRLAEPLPWNWAAEMECCKLAV
jgi:hypothetical protein